MDWSYRANYMEETAMGSRWNGPTRHEGRPTLRIDPDPGSRSGRSVRTIGNSTGAGCLVTVITVEEAGITYGVNGWKSNEVDIRRYREERL